MLKHIHLNMYLKNPNHKSNTDQYYFMYTFVYNVFKQGNDSMKDYLYAYALYLMVWVQRQKLHHAWENDAKKYAKRLIVSIFKYIRPFYVMPNVGRINPFTNYEIFQLDDDNAFKAFLESILYNRFKLIN